MADRVSVAPSRGSFNDQFHRSWGSRPGLCICPPFAAFLLEIRKGGYAPPLPVHALIDISVEAGNIPPLRDSVFGEPGCPNAHAEGSVLLRCHPEGGAEGTELRDPFDSAIGLAQDKPVGR